MLMHSVVHGSGGGGVGVVQFRLFRAFIFMQSFFQSIFLSSLSLDFTGGC